MMDRAPKEFRSEDEQKRVKANEYTLHTNLSLNGVSHDKRSIMMSILGVETYENLQSMFVLAPVGTRDDDFAVDLLLHHFVNLDKLSPELQRAVRTELGV